MATERALTFECAGEQLVGVCSVPDGTPAVGVLLVVGGPQYRVGSHRQFVLLARRLAHAGVPVLRFDYRGMGDSTGEARTFEEVVPDIAAAADAFQRAHPSLRKIVLWGLCDAASAALLYWRSTHDARVAGMVLLNPWVRSDQSLARTHVKHYYGQRLLERDFWSKLLRGKLNMGVALREFGRSLVSARADRGPRTADESTYQKRMAAGLGTFRGPVLLILSGRDLTAKEFLDHVRSDAAWQGLVERDNLESRDLPEADHTFSTAEWREQVESLTLDWIRRSFSAGRA